MEELKDQYETNLFGLTRVTQATIPVMRKQKSGTIINISSGVVTIGAYPGGSAYVSTKFALEGLSKSIAYELEPFGIKVVLVEPGLIRTNMYNNIVVASKSQDPNSPFYFVMGYYYSPCRRSTSHPVDEAFGSFASSSLVGQ